MIYTVAAEVRGGLLPRRRAIPSLAPAHPCTDNLEESTMTDASHGGAAKAQQPLAYKDMTPSQKFRFVLKVAACILTFGFAFPNVMSD